MKITCSCGALIFSDGYLDPDTYIKRFLDMHKPCREAYVKFIKKIDETAYASGFDEVSERLEALEEAEHHVPQKRKGSLVRKENEPKVYRYTHKDLPQGAVFVVARSPERANELFEIIASMSGTVIGEAKCTHIHRFYSEDFAADTLGE